MPDISTILVSFSCAVLAAVITSRLSARREIASHGRALNKERYDEIKTLYAEALASLEKMIRKTESLGDYSELFDEVPITNARLELSAPPQILEQFALISNLMFAWSSEYRQGAPKQIGPRGMSMISSTDRPHQERAAELYPKLTEGVVELGALMKAHLQELETKREQNKTQHHKSDRAGGSEA